MSCVSCCALCRVQRRVDRVRGGRRGRDRRHPYDDHDAEYDHVPANGGERFAHSPHGQRHDLVGRDQRGRGLPVLAERLDRCGRARDERRGDNGPLQHDGCRQRAGVRLPAAGCARRRQHRRLSRLVRGAVAVHVGAGALTDSGVADASSIKVDGHNAYLPSAVHNFLIGTESPPGRQSRLTVTSSRASNGNLTVTESAPLMRCSVSDTYPPTSNSCPSLTSTGVTFSRVSMFVQGAHQIVLTTRWPRPLITPSRCSTRSHDRTGHRLHRLSHSR